MMTNSPLTASTIRTARTNLRFDPFMFSIDLALLTELLPEAVFHTGNNEEPKKGRVWRPGPCVLNSVAKPVRYSVMMR